MKFGNRASLQAIVRKTEDVPFPEDDTFYRIREMSGTERDRFEIASFKTVTRVTQPTMEPSRTNGHEAPTMRETVREIDPLYLRARLVAMCLIDEEGNRVYDDGQVQVCSDELPASTLAKLFAAAQKLNGLEATAVEDAAKNSESEPGDGLPSSSPDTSAKPSLNS